jgi:hypothetical protein
MFMVELFATYLWHTWEMTSILACLFPMILFERSLLVLPSLGTGLPAISGCKILPMAMLEYFWAKNNLLVLSFALSFML